MRVVSKVHCAIMSDVNIGLRIYDMHEDCCTCTSNRRTRFDNTPHPIVLFRDTSSVKFGLKFHTTITSIKYMCTHIGFASKENCIYAVTQHIWAGATASYSGCPCTHI